MKQVLLRTALGCVCAGALLVGCTHKTDAKSELDKAAAALGTPEPTPAPAAPAPEPSAPTTSEPTLAVPSVPTLAVTPAREMQQAITSYKAGELEDAVTRLHALRASPSLTAEQRMAVQDGVAAVMAEIYSLAAKGDPRAILAVKQYEELQTGHR
jgi:hypothetical protein